MSLTGQFRRIRTLQKYSCLTALVHCQCRNVFEKHTSKSKYELDQRKEKCNCLGNIAKVDLKNGKYQTNILFVSSRDLNTAPMRMSEGAWPSEALLCPCKT